MSKAEDTRADEQAQAEAHAQAEQAEQRVEEDIDALLADVRRERDEYLELAQRTRADFENYKKRLSRETTEAEQRGTAKLARELISVVDNLERALQAAGISPTVEPGEETAGEAPAVGDPLAEGVLLVYKELFGTLSRAGVEPYDPAGEKFDPEWHEALMARPEEGVEGGTVIEVLEKGYRLNGQVLRAARVVVSQ